MHRMPVCFAVHGRTDGRSDEHTSSAVSVPAEHAVLGELTEVTLKTLVYEVFSFASAHCVCASTDSCVIRKHNKCSQSSDACM